MGFPSTWALPKGSRVAQRAVGNAMCVALSKAIVLAAVAVQKCEASVRGEAVTAPAAPSPAPTKTPRAFELSYLTRVVRCMEALCKVRGCVASVRCARGFLTHVGLFTMFTSVTLSLCRPAPIRLWPLVLSPHPPANWVCQPRCGGDAAAPSAPAQPEAA